MTDLAMPAMPHDLSAAQRSQWRFALFARMWAAAALFHLLGNARDAVVTSLPLAISSALLGVAAAWALLAPHRLLPLLVLCGLVPVTAWYEAPVVGNHWVLASLISLALVLSMLTSRLRDAATTPADVWHGFAPTARVTLLVAYSFAAFAKLNSDFLDPSVSCAVYYHNQLVGSWGLAALRLSGASAASHAVTFGAVLTEVAVAITVAVPRTRRYGLVLAAGFHWLLAMDLSQHFWDFSAVLFAVFLLFLDDPQVDALRRWSSRHLPGGLVRPSLRGLVVVGTVVATVVALNVLPLPTSLDVLRLLIGHATWWAYGTAVMVAVILLVRTPSDPRQGGRTQPHVAVLWVVPALALLNGLTPYLEVKTGYGWNMYSNLRTVAGETNHLLVPGTLDLTGAQRDRVRILDSSDPELQALVGTEYELAYREFRTYAHENPTTSVTYERNGRVHEAATLAEDPASQGDVSGVAQRLLPFRLIDVSGSERCRPVFQAAR